jgi:hypothetical protein
MMYVRFTPKADTIAGASVGLLVPLTSLTRRSKKVPLFDHLVGEREPAEAAL